jgi:hypothetical protein
MFADTYLLDVIAVCAACLLLCNAYIFWLLADIRQMLKRAPGASSE